MDVFKSLAIRSTLGSCTQTQIGRVTPTPGWCWQQSAPRRPRMEMFKLDRIHAYSVELVGVAITIGKGRVVAHGSPQFPTELPEHGSSCISVGHQGGAPFGIWRSGFVEGFGRDAQR